MNISKLFASASLAFAIVGGAMTLAPTSAVAAGNGKHISYKALDKNRVNSSRTNANYYNARPGAKANPYTRGCSKLSRCARS